MTLPFFFLVVDVLLVFWTTFILFLFSREKTKKITYFLKIFSAVLAIMIVGYFITIYAMFGSIIPRDTLILSISLIVITNILLYIYYHILLKQKLQFPYPILMNIIYMSIVIYIVYHFWHI